MNVSLARIGVRFGFCLCLLSALAPRKSSAQLSGLFQSAPGTVATYQYQANGIQSVVLPVDLTLNFSDDNPTSMLTAAILKPIIGAEADGTPIYPIAAFFPMRVTGASLDGQEFHGDLLDTQYLFDWEIQSTSMGELLLNGHVYWAGGRIEVTTINQARLIPAVAGDYNRDGTVNAADYIVWRKFNNTATTLPTDLTPGTDQSDYDVWRAHFGQSAGSGASASVNAVVPEPSTLVLLMLTAAGLCLRRCQFAQ